MSASIGWPPGPSPDSSGPQAEPCERCGHRASSHLRPGSCSVRGRWWRRCPCTGFTAADSATPAPAGPRSPVDR